MMLEREKESRLIVKALFVILMRWEAMRAIKNVWAEKLNHHAWDLKNHSVGCEADGLEQKEVRVREANLEELAIF